jgi:hypothetical protein
MTYSGGYVLDYLWVSPTGMPLPLPNNTINDNVNKTRPTGIRIASTWQSHPDAANNRRTTWPSQHVPSDHLPIGATLVWTKERPIECHNTRTRL